MRGVKNATKWPVVPANFLSGVNLVIFDLRFAILDFGALFSWLSVPNLMTLGMDNVSWRRGAIYK